MEDEFGLIGTIDDSLDVDYDEGEIDSDFEEDPDAVKVKKKKIVKKEKCAEMEDSFKMTGLGGDTAVINDIVSLRTVPGLKKDAAIESILTLEEKIAEARKKLEMTDKEILEEAEAKKKALEEEEDSSEDEKEDIVRTKIKRDKKGNEKNKIQYAEEVTALKKSVEFAEMNLSRPLLKALSNLGFSSPTPIQKACIPIALLGKDVCACAATGTGKTAAFMLPIIERLLYKPNEGNLTRVLILTPTRELAIQIHQVTRELLKYSNLVVALAAGGLDIATQEASLRLGPDIVIATPGRIIDNLYNAHGFNLNDVEILVLDEADRMLDEYFAEEMKEVIRLCSFHRQTMLFSATMTEEVQDLATVSLKDPVKIFVNQNTDVAMNLRQEFIRIRPNREGDREAIIAALIKRQFQDHCIVFIQTKKQAHRMHIVLGLLGVKAGELHGNLTQIQRLDTLDGFKKGSIDVLLASDLASRGLDIENVKTVINFTMPKSYKQYVHRVGRTARAGKQGRAITLAGESERKVMKEIIKNSRSKVKSRIVPQDVIDKYTRRIESLESSTADIYKAERLDQQFKVSAKNIEKAKNLLTKTEQDTEETREWFQTEQQKKSLKDKQRLTPKNRKEDSKKRTASDRVAEEQEKAQLYAARAAKRQKKAYDEQFVDGTFRKRDNPTKQKKGKQGGGEAQLGFWDRDLSAPVVKKKKQNGMSYQERREKKRQQAEDDSLHRRLPMLKKNKHKNMAHNNKKKRRK